MAETMMQLKKRAKKWPDPWGSHARGLIRDAHFELIFCQLDHVVRVQEHLRQALLATEAEMLERSDEAANLERHLGSPWQAVVEMQEANDKAGDLGGR